MCIYWKDSLELRDRDLGDPQPEMRNERIDEEPNRSGNSPLYRDDIEYQSRRYFENRTRLLGWLDTHAGRDSARPLSVSGDDFEKGLRAGPVAMKLANRDYFTWRNDSRQENAATHTARCRLPSCRVARAEHETAFQE